ncbi:MAG: hypothetical protein Q9162_000443 [Coniocarpon cinnabarinum]
MEAELAPFIPLSTSNPHVDAVLYRQRLAEQTGDIDNRLLTPNARQVRRSSTATSETATPSPTRDSGSGFVAHRGVALPMTWEEVTALQREAQQQGWELEWRARQMRKLDGVVEELMEEVRRLTRRIEPLQTANTHHERHLLRAQLGLALERDRSTTLRLRLHQLRLHSDHNRRVEAPAPLLTSSSSSAQQLQVPQSTCQSTSPAQTAHFRQNQQQSHRAELLRFQRRIDLHFRQRLEMEEEKSTLKLDLFKLEDENATLSSDNMTFNKDNTALLSDLEKSEDRNKAMHGALHRRTKEAIELRDHNDALQDALQHQTCEIEALKMQCHRLEQRERELESEWSNAIQGAAEAEERADNAEEKAEEGETLVAEVEERAAEAEEMERADAAERRVEILEAQMSRLRREKGEWVERAERAEESVKEPNV